MLHKTSYVRGFHIQASDGEVGHVDDFLFDPSWTIAYLVVDTSNWIGGKSMLIPASAVERVDSPDKKIYVKMTSEEVKNGRSIDTADIELIETLPPVIL
jgi:PRC-barrel domain